jgi:hypothetical protein
MAYLELKCACQNCGIALPPESVDARICSFECTFCTNCVDTILHNVCPSCGGGFEKRPIRRKGLLQKFPAQIAPFVKPLSSEDFSLLFEKFKEIPPELR